MNLRILRPGLEDLAAGRSFYNRRGKGVGNYFYDSLFAEIDSLVLYAGIHPIRFGFYRLLAKRFPYAVYYRTIAEEAVVFRVLDCRRDPEWIRKTLAATG